MHTQKQEERERKVIESLGVLFLPHLGRTFPSSKSLNRRRRGRIKTVQVRKENEGFEKITKGERERIEADSGSQMLSCRCSVEWQATCSNLVEYDWQLHNDDRDAASFV